MTRPIKSSDIASLKKKSIPSEVFEAFNELIVENLVGKRAKVSQRDAYERVKSKLPKSKHKDIYDKGWMDVEDAYRDEGWKVIYDKPGYSETYEASYEFVAKRDGE